MNELQKIAQLFDDLQSGECWVGPNMQKTLAGVSVQMAVQKSTPRRNNIWQLVNHIIYWRKTVMLRLNGKDEYPSMQDFYCPAKPTEESWRQTLQEFNATFEAFRDTITALDPVKLDGPSGKAGQTCYQLLMGCLQHDVYHMGQMVVLKKDFA